MWLRDDVVDAGEREEARKWYFQSYYTLSAASNTKEPRDLLMLHSMTCCVLLTRSLQ